jgi:shikimate dehydrogenase
MTDHYAVLGNPIAHSKSPLIHRLFAQQTQQDMDYDAILFAIDAFNEGVQTLHLQGFQGMNVTVPFKFEAFHLCETVSERAQMAGAVNTLIRTATGWRGDNTDGAGLVADLRRLFGTLTGKQVLLLGAGGAASGVVKPLLDAEVDHLTIANRNADKAVALSTQAQHIRVNGCGYDVVPNQPYDIIINATAASLNGDLPPLKTGWFSEHTLAYDMMYAKNPTVFMQAATTFGAGQVCDGLGMLIEQAAEAFFLWRGIRPDTTAVRQALIDDSQIT